MVVDPTNAVIGLLWLYWVLATGAAATALLPRGWCDGFRCVDGQWQQIMVDMPHDQHSSFINTHFQERSHIVSMQRQTMGQQAISSIRLSHSMCTLAHIPRTSHSPHTLTHTQHWSVPQQWFWHFYALGAAVNSVMLYALYVRREHVTRL